MEQPKLQLKINMIDLESAFEYNDFLAEMSHFLDLETGEVVMTMAEDRRLLEEIYEEHADPQSGKLDWPAVLPGLGLHDWQIERLLVTDLVENGFNSRFIAIPQDESYEGYNDMVSYIETVSDPRFRARLERAISGKGAFRRFKDILLDYPEERQRWFHFQNDRLHQRILDWLTEVGIEPL